MSQRLLIVLLSVAVSALAACSAPGGPAGSSGAGSPSLGSTTATSGPVEPSKVATDTAPPTQATSSSAVPVDDAATKAATKIKTLTAYLGSGGVSVEAVRLDDGAKFRYGARRGMASGSIAKLYTLEVLLLQRQDEQEDLSEDERDLTRRMIVNSDNAAADELYAAIGAGEGLTKAAARLGVLHTVPGPGLLWGFNQTNARDYIALLRNLVTPSVLSAQDREYALDLMEDVEAEQRWGVSAAADDDTTVRLKDGWLPSDMDGGRWLVNSVGIVTVQGHRVLLAVMTQHGSSFEGGIDLVERISRLAAAVVAPG